MALAGVGVVLVLVVAAVVVLHGRGGGHELKVTLVALDAHPSDAFADSVVTVKASAARGFATKQRADAPGARTVSGDTKGLYGSSSTALANPAGLASGLTGARGAAWAQVMGVPSGRVAATLGSLTPLVAAHDLLVTEHGYAASGVTQRPVVLEAGTTVGVDHFGRPVVNLATGDPLSQLASGVGQRLDFVGDEWSGFDSGGVVDIEATPKPVDQLGTVDITTGAAATTALGGTVSLDGYLVADDSGVSVMSFDRSETTPVVDHAVARVFDDGSGGIVYQDRHPVSDSSDGLASDRVMTPPSDADQAAIWWLAAGSSDPVKIVTTDDPSTHWPILDAAGVLGGRPVVLYEDARASAIGATDGPNGYGTMHLLDLGSRKDVTLDDAPSSGSDDPSSSFAGGGTGYGGGVQIAAITDDGVSWMSLYQATMVWHFFDPDLKPRDPAGYQCLQEHDAGSGECFGDAIDDRGDIARVDAQDSGDLADADLDTVDPRTARVTHSVGMGSGGLVPASWSLDVHDGKAIYGTRDASGDPAGTQVVLTLASGRAQTFQTEGLVRFLRAPLVRPASDAGGATGGAPATSGAPATTASAETTPATPPLTVPPSSSLAPCTDENGQPQSFTWCEN